MIAIEGLTKRYGDAYAVKDAFCVIPDRAFVALVGQSGSGKTTLLKCINRLIEPDAGRVLIDGEPVTGQDPPTLRRSIGYVFQGIGLFPHMTVAENIGVTPRLLGWSPEDASARAVELLDLVELPRAYGDRMPSALSGGQRQRVGIARALAARPRILLMDEPFGALDPVTRDTLGQACRDLHERLGLTTVMVTHDVQEAVLLADRIVVMKDGRILADDVPRALMTGHTDPDVAALMGSPRRQAERVQALIGSAQ